MINISDLVENVKDIHPRNKRAIGERLACLAMDKVYGQFTGAYESPRLHEARVVKRNLEVTLEGEFQYLAFHHQRGDRSDGRRRYRETGCSQCPLERQDLTDSPARIESTLSGILLF